MFVTVIIPNYNHFGFLKQRIDSILNQTYQNYEIIILDDHSKDKSRDVIEIYRQHPKVSQIVYNDINSGSTFKQWNKGVNLAKGDLIWIAESDDKSSVDFLSSLVNILDQNPKVGIAYSNSYFIDADNQILRSYVEEFASWSDRWQHDYINAGINEVVKYLRFSPVILNVSSCVFRKKVFDEAGQCDEDLKLAGDWFTYVKMLQRSDIAYCAQPLNYFRCHSQTVRNNSKQFVHFIESLKVICFIYQHFPVPPEEKRAHAYSLLAQFSQLAPQFSSEQRAMVIRYLRRNFMRHIDLLRWKYEVSVQVKRMFQSK